MSNVLIAFLASVSAAAWTYSKLIRSTGGNTQNSAIGAVITGVLAFIVAFTLLKLIPGA